VNWFNGLNFDLNNSWFGKKIQKLEMIYTNDYKWMWLLWLFLFYEKLSLIKKKKKNKSHLILLLFCSKVYRWFIIWTIINDTPLIQSLFWYNLYEFQKSMWNNSKYEENIKQETTVTELIFLFVFCCKELFPIVRNILGLLKELKSKTFRVWCSLIDSYVFISICSLLFDFTFFFWNLCIFSVF